MANSTLKKVQRREVIVSVGIITSSPRAARASCGGVPPPRRHIATKSRPNRCGRRSRTAATRYVVDSAHGNLMRNRDSASQLGDAMRHSCSPIVANACSWPTTTPCREEPRRLIRGDRMAFAMVISLAYLRSRRVDRLSSKAVQSMSVGTPVQTRVRPTRALVPTELPLS